MTVRKLLYETYRLKIQVSVAFYYGSAETWCSLQDAANLPTFFEVNYTYTQEDS